MSDIYSLFNICKSFIINNLVIYKVFCVWFAWRLWVRGWFERTRLIVSA